MVQICARLVSKDITGPYYHYYTLTSGKGTFSLLRMHLKYHCSIKAIDQAPTSVGEATHQYKTCARLTSLAQSVAILPINASNVPKIPGWRLRTGRCLTTSQACLQIQLYMLNIPTIHEQHSPHPHKTHILYCSPFPCAYHLTHRSLI